MSILLHVLKESASLHSRVEGMEKEVADLAKKIESLEAQLNQSSNNSSRPPSSDSPFKRKPAGRGTGRPGTKAGHPGYRQKLLEPNHIRPVVPEGCTCGCRDFDDVSAYYTHQEIELPEIEMDVTHFILYRGTCRQCGKLVKARIPKGHETGYGPRFTAFIAETTIGNSRGRVQGLVRSVLGTQISRGALQSCIDRASEAIFPYYEAIADKARTARVNFIDETPWFQNGILMWLWVMVNGEVGFFKIQTSRSKEAFEALSDRWAGILVSDGYGVYRKWINQRQTF
jgi:transposase